MKIIDVKGIRIRMEAIEDDKDYVSLTDIIKDSVDEPKETIRSWIKNTNTVRFLWAWEEMHNPDFKGGQLHAFIEKVTNNRYNLSPTKWIESTNAIGIVTKRGRGGGTFVHQDIALEFCSWFDPYFKVFLMKAFKELAEREFNRQSLEWHISKLTDNVEEMRNLLDTIPGQDSQRNNMLE